MPSEPDPSPTINATAASVLGFLGLGPLTGWDLNELAQISVGHFWNMTRSQVYRELATLTDLGYIASDDPGSRNSRRHHLTDSGRARLHEWLVDGPTNRIERNAFLVKLFFAEHLTEAERADLVATARAEMEAELAVLEAVLPMAEQLSPYAAATAHYGIAVKKAALDWFDARPWEHGR